MRLFAFYFSVKILPFKDWKHLPRLPKNHISNDKNVDFLTLIYCNSYEKAYNTFVRNIIQKV